MRFLRQEIQKYSSKLSNRLITLCIVTTLLPILLFSWISMVQQSKSYEKEIQQNFQREVQQTAAKMDVVFTQIRTLNNLFYYDSRLKDILKAEDTDLEQMSSDAMDQMFLQYKYGPNSLQFNTLVVSKSGWAMGDIPNVELFDWEKFQSREFYTDILANQGKLLWRNDSYLDYLFSPEGQDEKFVYAVRQVYNYSDWTFLGVLITGVPVGEIQGSMGWAYPREKSYYLVDIYGRVIDSIDFLGLKKPNFMDYRMLQSEVGGELLQEKDGKLNLSYATIGTNQWKVVEYSRIPDMDWLQNRYLIVAGLYFFVAVSVLYTILRKWLTPLHALIGKMIQVKNGNLNVSIAPTSSDEIGELTVQFNSMVCHTKKLLDTIREKEKAKREAEIASLKMQINPHFLYNTLATIRYMVQFEKPENTDAALVSLIQLLRDTLSDTDELITVEKEIFNLMSYVSIRLIARERAFQITYDFAPEITHDMMLKLTLQPLVENAIEHGLQDCKNGKINIRGWIEGNDLLFCVQDNGRGADLKKIAFDPNVTELRMKDRIGMQNVHSRIRLHYGKPYGLTIKSEQGEGMQVFVRLPRIKGEKGYNSYEHIDRG